MNKMEKYLAAIEAAVEAKDSKAMELLEDFATYVYQDLYAVADNASGEEKAVWNDMYKRAQTMIARMAKAGPEIWD